MNPILNMILWFLGATLLSFGVSGIFSGKLRWSRRLFLLPYLLLSSVFLVLFVSLNDIHVMKCVHHNHEWGILAGILASGVLILNIRSQRKSQTLKGRFLLFDLIWLGLFYGLMDGLILNAMPVIAVKEMFGGFEAQRGIGSVLLEGGIALTLSLIITLFYHIGYKEFRNKSVFLVLVGNTIITLAFVFSNNLLGALISHTVMHLAAVLRGPETTIQLPPHYSA